MQKSIIYLALLICVCGIRCNTVYAQVFTKNRPLSVIHSEYFDIIYPKESSNAAFLIASHADSFYKEIAASLKVEQFFRMPVVITPDKHVLNAYFSPFPYNRIVLYDTISSEGSLATYDNTLLSVFYHELTHAVTANIRGTGEDLISKITGDIFAPAMILNTVPLFMEGAAVLYESAKGFGRLNDPLTYHMLMQAKLENAFPDWQSASGVSDTYPSGSLPYIFGGTFSAFLFNTYGADYYAAFWQEAGKIRHSTLLEGVFKSVYGTSLKTIWKDFENSIVLPSTIVFPDAPFINTISVPSGIFTSISSGKKGLAWIDKASSSVYFLNTQSPEKKPTKQAKPTKLFSVAAEQARLSFSPDGSLLLVSTTNPEGVAIRIFDIHRKSFTPFFYSDLRDAAFITLADGNLGVAGISYTGSASQLSVISADFRKSADVRIIAKKTLSQYSCAYTPIDAGAGLIAYIETGFDNYENIWQRSLMFYDIALNETHRLVVEGKQIAALRYISPLAIPSQGMLFSWSDTDSFYRIGILDMNTQTVRLQSQDYSGGIHFPVAHTDKVYYSGLFASQERLFSAPLDILLNEESETLPIRFETIQSAAQKTDMSQKDITESFRIETYNPLSYITQGTFLPNAAFTIHDDNSFDSAFGFMYISATPTEHYQIGTEVLFHVLSCFFDISLSLSGFEPDFQWSVVLADTLREQSGMYTRLLSLDVGSTLPFYVSIARNSLSLQHLLSFDIYTDTFSPQEINKSWSLYTKAFTGIGVTLTSLLSFSSVRRAGLHPLEMKGFSFAIQGSIAVKSTFPTMRNVQLPLSGAVRYKLYIPRLLPLSNPSGLTISLPSSLSFSTDFAVFSDGFLASKIESDTVLFAFDVGHALPLVPLYAHRIVFSGGYSGTFLHSFVDRLRLYDDSVFARVALICSPLIGTTVTAKADISLTFSYLFRSKKMTFKGGFALFY